MPITRAAREVASSYTRRWQRWLLLPLGIGVLGLPSLISLASATGGQSDLWGLGVLAFAALALVVWLSTPLPRRLSRDLHSSTYLSTTGLIRYSCLGVVGSYDGEGIVHELWISGRRLMWSPPTIEEITALERLSWGTVDYLKHSDVVLEIRDEGGEIVYRHPSYRPLPDTRVADSVHTATAA